MRIVHTCLRYPPATGGVETYVHELVERTRQLPPREPSRLKRPVRDVRVLTSKMRTHGPISELKADTLLDDPIYVQRLHHAATPFISYPRLQALKYYIGHHKPDIIHGHSFWYQPADVAARYARRHNIPFIFHPYYYDTEIRHKAHWRLYKNTIGKRTFAAASVVVVISPFEQKSIESAGFPVQRFVLAPPGIDAQKLQRPKADPFAARNIHGTIVLAVGRIAKTKGLDDVIAALPHIIKEMPQTQIVLAGENFGEKKILKRLAQRLNVSQHIHWLGKLEQDELIGAYQHATVLVHPSHFEAFGITPAEALAAGTPVVARRAAALPYVVPDQKVGLLFETQDELITAILTLLKNPSLRQRFGEAGKKHVAESFSWAATIKKMTDLYEEFGQSREA